MRIIFEKVRDGNGHLHDVVQLKGINAEFIVEAAPNSQNIKYLQVVDGRPVAGFTDEQILVVEL